MKILELQERFLGDIVRKLENPKWVPELNSFNRWVAETLASKDGRKAFPRQLEVVIAPHAYNFIKEEQKAGIIIGEMGVGKTQMSNDILYLLFKAKYESEGMRALFLVSGGKHIKKMVREASDVLGEAVEAYVIKTSPRKRPVKVNEKISYQEITIDQALKMPRKPGKILYFFLSKDTGKLSWKKEGLRIGEKRCPSCGTKETSRLRGRRKKEEFFVCPKCKSSIWTYKRRGASSAVPFAEKIKRSQKYKADKKWDFAIVDEVHEMQNPWSDQSKLYHAVIGASSQTLIMTGTMANGYSSSLFYILYPLIPYYFKRYGGFKFDNIGAFIDFFGAKKETSAVVVSDFGSDSKSVRIQELPQINDRISGFLAPFTTWLSIEDLGVEMPEMIEKSVVADNDPMLQRVKRLAEESFELFLADIRNALGIDYADIRWKNFARSAKLGFRQSVSYWINNPFGDLRYSIPSSMKKVLEEIVGESVEIRDFVFQGNLPFDYVTTKEQELLDIIRKETREGRRILLYGAYIHTNGLFGRLSELLENNLPEVSVEVIPDSVKAEDIEAAITSSEADVVMVSQKRVATGLDLVQFQTVVFYEIDRQVRIVEQAKMRPYRPIGQEHEVRVYYLAYSGNQERELERTAMKMRASASVNGRIVSDNSIAGIYDYDPDMTDAIRALKNKILEVSEHENVSVLVQENSPLHTYYQSLLSLEEDDEGSGDLGCSAEETLEISAQAIEKEEEVLPVPEVEFVEVEIKIEEGGQMAFSF